jgi:protein-disulfide isomerase
MESVAPRPEGRAAFQEIPMPSRRIFLNALAAAGLAAAALTGLQGAAMAQAPSAADLAVAGPMGDVELGSKDAKVTIYEYASMTCSHCAAFHKGTWPTLKSKYVDTGKVRFILREFPLDPLATAGFMLARCAGNDKYYAVIDLLFDQQKNWAFTDKPLEALLGLMKQAGFSQESFMACLKNQEIYDAVNWVKDRGAREFKVDSTPTFFIGDQVRRGELSVEELEKILTPLVGG